jgi:phenylpropionate dioxygenase-like ring-hydroxylating dioxygenase large terminal subunit
MVMANRRNPNMSRFIADLVRSQPVAYSLQQGLYNSPEVFARDMDCIFGRYWILAGHQSSAPDPGDWFVHEMADESIIIVRGKDMQLRAFANVCRHRGSRICKGSSGHASQLICPYHGWIYELDGRLAAARLTAPDFDLSCRSLKSVHIEVVEGLVFVSIADRPLSIDTARAAITAAVGPYGWASARVAHRETYPIAANWKLAVENYIECYHCAPAHPEYSRLHSAERPRDRVAKLNEVMEARTRALGFEVRTIDHRVGSGTGEQAIAVHRYSLYNGASTGTEDGRPVAPLMGAFTDYDGGVTSVHFSPSSFFIAYADHGVLYRFIPHTPTTSSLEVIWLVNGSAKEELDYNRNKLTWMWRVTSEADKRIIEDNQLGVNSRFYEPGPYTPMEEKVTAWSQWYLKEIT